MNLKYSYYCLYSVVFYFVFHFVLFCCMCICVNACYLNGVFSTWKQNVDQYMDFVEKAIPNYHESVTSLQQEYIQATENVIDSAISVQKEFATKAGINTNVPDATLKAVQTSNEQVIKAYDVQKKVTIASIDAARQNVKSFNDNAKAFSELNGNVLQSWVSAFTPKY